LKKIIVFSLVSLLAFGSINAQDEVHHEEHEHNDGFHRLTMVVGYTFIDNSFTDQTDDILIVPAFGLNYDYFFKGVWGLGLHTDVLLQQFNVEEKNSNEVLIRENPIAVCGMLLYKTHHKWTLFSGYGIEFENHENIQLIRIGGEFGIELRADWELGFTLEFDIKPGAYNSLLFGVDFSKFFFKKKKNSHTE